MAEPLAPSLWRLEIPLVGNPLKTLNSYLITGERSLLIDTGFRQQPCREAMERQLQELGVDRDRMDIFCTHLHSDHTGLSSELIRPGCQILIGEIDGPGLLRTTLPSIWEDLYRQYIQEGFSRQEMDLLWEDNPAKNAAPVWVEQAYRFLKDGEELHYGGHTLRCVLTPGHTPGHLCLYEPAQKWLFSGDHVLFHITPNICRWPDVPDSLGDYLHSLDKVAQLEVAQVFPAHRADTGVLRQRVDELKAHHAHRLESIVHILEAHPGLTAYELASKMTWSIRCRDWDEFPLTQKYFAVGEALSHLDHLAALGQVVCQETGGKRRYSLPPR